MALPRHPWNVSIPYKAEGENVGIKNQETAVSNAILRQYEQQREFGRMLMQPPSDLGIHQHQLGGYGAARRVTDGPVDDGIQDAGWRMRALYMRLRVPNAALLPFDHINTAMSADRVFVFVLVGDKPAVLEDDVSLFPSDTLIAQLNLIKK